MRKLFYIIILLCTAICACQRKSAVGDGLNRADALINASLADSALALLDSMDLTDADAGDYARYALLKSKATSLTFPKGKFDDSLLTLAADYYAGRGDSLELQSQYLLGRFLNYRMSAAELDYNRKLIALRRALDLAESSNDSLHIALVYYALANNPACSRQECGGYYYKAGKCYQSIGNINKAISCLSVAARNFNANGDDSTAIALLLEVREMVDTITDNMTLQEYDMAINLLRNQYLTKSDFERLKNEAKNRHMAEMSKRPPRSITDSSKVYIR